MSKPRSQAEIVAQDMLRRGDGQEVTDKLRIPGLDSFFVVDGEVNEETNVVRIAGLSELIGESRQDIAEMLVGVLKMRRGLTSIDWTLGDSSLTVGVSSTTTVERTKSDEDLIELLVTVFKARSNITRFHWDLNAPYLELSYLS